MRALIDYRSALRRRSGVGEYAHQLVRALLAAFPPATSGRPLDLTIFSSSWKDRVRIPAEFGGIRTIDRRIPVSALNFMWHRLGWPSAESLTASTFDVTHSLHPLLLPSRNAAQVVTIHDLDFLEHPDRTRAEIRRDYPRLARDHARRADHIIVPSRTTAEEVGRRFEVAAERISVCAPGAPDWPPRKAAPAAGYVLFFGTLEPRKNIGTLLDAYERLLAGEAESTHGGDTSGGAVPELVLAGTATLESRVWLDRISRPPLAGRVRHVGYVEAAQRRALYEGARLLVQPSFDEGFGMPVLEAMTLGVPVVAANRGALPEVLEAAGLLVDPNNADDLAAAIARVSSDRGLADALAAKGIARARAFQWSTTAARVYDAYRIAIERRREKSAAHSEVTRRPA